MLALDCAKARIESTTPHESTSLRNLSEKVHLEPKADCLSVMFSFVCESNVGFSIKQLTKTLRCACSRRVRRGRS